MANYAGLQKSYNIFFALYSSIAESWEKKKRKKPVGTEYSLFCLIFLAITIIAINKLLLLFCFYVCFSQIDRYNHKIFGQIVQPYKQSQKTWRLFLNYIRKIAIIFFPNLLLVLLLYNSNNNFCCLFCEGPLTDSDPVQRHTLRKDGVLDRKGGVLDRKRSASRPRKLEVRTDSRSRCSKTDEVLSAGYHSEGMYLNNIMLSPNHNTKYK